MGQPDQCFVGELSKVALRKLGEGARETGLVRDLLGGAVTTESSQRRVGLETIDELAGVSKIVNGLGKKRVRQR